MDREIAKGILLECDAFRDFHALPSDDVERLIGFADLHKYRQPKNANGSRARYFHAFLTRVANRKES